MFLSLMDETGLECDHQHEWTFLNWLVCMQQNEVGVLTDAERKETPGQGVGATHVKPCLCSGRIHAEAEGILSAGEREGTRCLV